MVCLAWLISVAYSAKLAGGTVGRARHFDGMHMTAKTSNRSNPAWRLSKFKK